MAKAAIMGYGVVGGGTAEVLIKNKDRITKKTNEEITLKYILDIRKFPGDPNEALITDDFETILNDPEVSVVAEVMGGLNPAYDFSKRLLMAGKSVVTSNKELVSVHGPELMKLAKENNVKYLFEASVGGGIPVIKPLNNCLSANNILEIKGILNGTTNYILTQMFSEGVDFKTALSDAMDKGYAEKDPTADIEGHDALRKISILASLAWGEYVSPDSVYAEGISKITSEDVEYAELLGGSIKLIGSAVKKENGVLCSVEPQIVNCENPIFSVNGVFNCVMITGDAVGDVMFYGQGAGKLATASAVVADIIEAVMDKSLSFPFNYEIKENSASLPYSETEAAYLVRVSKESEYNIEKISALSDKNTRIMEIKDDEIAFVSEKMKVSELDKALSDMNVIRKIRICK